MEVYFKKKQGFIHYKITAMDRKTLIFKKEVYEETSNDLLELKDLINFYINIKPCKSQEQAQKKINNIYNLYTDEVNEYLKIENNKKIINLIQENL